MFCLCPHTSDIDVVDHFSLNQCRSEEITLKEDFGNNFLNFADIGKSWIVFLLKLSCYYLCLCWAWFNSVIEYYHFFPYLSLIVGDERQIYHNALMDVSFQSLAQHGDAFGDEDQGFDLLGSLTWIDEDQFTVSF